MRRRKMEDGGKSKKKLGLSLKSSKKRAVGVSKADSKKAARNLDSSTARKQTFDGYFTKQKQEKIEGQHIADGQHVNSTTELAEGFEGTRGLSISSTRMKLLDLMPVFPDWEKMKPLPFSALMESFSERKRANSVQCNDQKETTNENVEPGKNDAANGYHWKDLPKFDAGLFNEKMMRPLLTVDNGQEDDLRIDSPTTSAVLQVDCDSKSKPEDRLIEASDVDKSTEISNVGKCTEESKVFETVGSNSNVEVGGRLRTKSNEDRLTEESNVNETSGKRKSNPSIEVGGRLRTSEETASSQSENELFQMQFSEPSRVSEVEEGTSDDELLAIYQDIALEEDSMDCMIVPDTMWVSPKRNGKPSSRNSSEAPSKTFGQTKGKEPVFGSGNSENVSMNFQACKSPQPCTIDEGDNQKSLGSHGECGGSRSSTTLKDNEKTTDSIKNCKSRGRSNKTKDFPESYVENDDRMGVNSIKKNHKMSSQSSDKPSHDDGNLTGNVKTKGERSFCKPGWHGEQSKLSVDSRGLYKDGRLSPAVVVNSCGRTSDIVNCTNKSYTQPADVLQDRGAEKAKYSSQNNNGKSIGGHSLFDNAAKERMSSAQFKSKESSCSREMLEDYNEWAMNYTKSETPDMFVGKSERDRTKGENLIPSSSSSRSGCMNIHAESSKTPPNRTGVPGIVSQKNNTGLRNEKRASFESGKSPRADVTILKNNVRSDNTLTVSGKGNDVKGGNQWIDEDNLYEEDDGLDDFMRSLDGDLNDDDLVSCCDDLMSPIIPVRKNASSTRQQNYAAVDEATGCRSKGAKRRLDIPDGQSKIWRSDRTPNTSDTGRLLAPRTTALSKNKDGANVLKDCPICLEHFHSGLSKRDIDQHIAGCLESEDMVKDSDELFW